MTHRILVTCLLSAALYSQQTLSNNEPREKRQGSRQIRLSFECPETRYGEGQIVVWSSERLVATAYCKNGEFNFTRRNMLEVELAMTAADIVPGLCQMQSDPRMIAFGPGKYYVEVMCGMGPYKSAIYFDHSVDNIICNYGTVGSSYANITRINKLSSKQKPPKQKSHFKGKTIPDKITLDVVGIRGNKIRGSITMSTVMRFRAVIHSPTKAIKALSCTATNERGSKYLMIRMGCGDGKVFGLTAGFANYGNVTYSPFFKVFRLAGSFRVRFTCKFAACKMSECYRRSSCHHVEHHLLKDNPYP